MTAPRKVSVRLTDDLSDDLAILARAGITASDAVRRGVQLLADGHRAAYDHGDIPDGRPVRILGVTYAAADGRPVSDSGLPFPSYASDTPASDGPHNLRTATGGPVNQKENHTT